MLDYDLEANGREPRSAHPFAGCQGCYRAQDALPPVTTAAAVYVLTRYREHRYNAANENEREHSTIRAQSVGAERAPGVKNKRRLVSVRLPKIFNVELCAPSALSRGQCANLIEQCAVLQMRDQDIN